MVEDEVSIFVPGGGGRGLTLCLTGEADLTGQLDPVRPVLQAAHHQGRPRNACRTFQLEVKLLVHLYLGLSTPQFSLHTGSALHV